MDPIDVLSQLIALPGPAGQEEAVREAVADHVRALGLSPETDAKGNLLVSLGHSPSPKVVVTAHLDEVAMIVSSVEPDGRLRVRPLGGLYPWKLGEGPVQILAPGGALDGILSFGSIHTDDPRSTVQQAISGPLLWGMAHVLTGLDLGQLATKGVRPGTRVVVHPCRRGLFRLGELVAGYFMDDRADLVSWIWAQDALKASRLDVMFAATAAEEVGGEGALWLLHRLQPEVCIALELGPAVPDAPLVLNEDPTLWVTDSYSTMSAADGELVEDVAHELGIPLQYQALSRGGSDASCAASHGACARPITLGLPMANSHGFEVMHPGAMATLGRLTTALVERLCQ